MSEGKQIAADDWTDTDLLTRAEAAERLDDEIATATEQLAALQASGGSEAAVDLVSRRLAAMKAARSDLV
ncbi:hypothetical protein, partial [Nocardia jinanensis]|uniref:hypothetical protein n=1 Tax=Nocardia jinanensis TaxID=382504 RepID=UPI00166E5303